MLDGAGDQVPSPGAFQRLYRAPNGNVVPFGPTARKQHLGGVRPNQLRHFGAGVVHGSLCLLPEMVDARRISELLPQNCRHPVDNTRQERGCGVVVQIDALHGLFES